MTTIAERVAAGAAFLDEHDPDWWKFEVPDAIDLDTLDLGDSGLCVLGQRCPLEVLNHYAAHPIAEDRYWAYVQALMVQVSAEEPVLIWAHDRGFTDARFEDFPALTDEWVRVIEQRRAAS